MKHIKSYRNIIRERKREIVNLTKSFSVKEDNNFIIVCDKYLTDSISIKEFNDYLDNDLDLININESWFSDLGDNISKKWNISSNFFNSIVAKVKAFIKSYLVKCTQGDLRDKTLELLSSFYEKIMSGMKMFGDFIKKNKKGLYSLLTKISVSLGISFTVTYILSFFSAGWVAALGAKMGASMVAKKAGEKVSKTVVGEGKLHSYNTFINEDQQTEQKPEQKPEQKATIGSSIKKGALVLGKGILSFFKVLRKFKIAILIFFGTVFILDLIFHPMFAPIVHIAQMHHLSDLFSQDFTPVANIPKVDLNKASEVKVVNITKAGASLKAISYTSDSIETKDMGQNIGISLDQSLNTLKENITNHPQDAAKGTGELINQLIPQVHDNNLDGMTGVTSQPAHDLTADDFHKTTGHDINDIRETEHEGELNIKAALASDEYLRKGEHVLTEAEQKVEDMTNKWDGLSKQISKLYKHHKWDEYKKLMIDNGLVTKTDDGHYLSNLSSINKEYYYFPGDKGYEEILKERGFDDGYDYGPVQVDVNEWSKIDGVAKTFMSSSNGGEGFNGMANISFTERADGKNIMMLTISVDGGEGREYFFNGDYISENGEKYEIDKEHLLKIVEKLFPEKVEDYKRLVLKK
jgi:hypothetical protein